MYQNMPERFSGSRNYDKYCPGREIVTHDVPVCKNVVSIIPVRGII